MAAIYAMLVADVLFVGFLVLTRFETSRGNRYFEGHRAQFDLKAKRVEFVLKHVDWGALLRDTTRTTFNTYAHEAATRTLILVRSTERVLTQAVHILRIRREGVSSGENVAHIRRSMNVNVERLKHGMRARKVPVNEEVFVSQGGEEK
jgi:hypothetical protein